MCLSVCDYNYDLHCDGNNGIIYQMNPFKLQSDSFTVAVWVRFLPGTTGVILTFYSARWAFTFTHPQLPGP